MGYSLAYNECRQRVIVHWHSLQTNFSEFRYYRLKWIAPTLGIRESYRVVCNYTLTENDLRSSFKRQPHPDMICLSDHAMDTHGRSTDRSTCQELETPYGVPFRCLIPKVFSNLMVACRGAGFSSIAASSCRLSRTMMQIGKLQKQQRCFQKS